MSVLLLFRIFTSLLITEFAQSEWEKSGKTDGDIDMSKDAINELILRDNARFSSMYNAPNMNVMNNAVKGENMIWPEGRVPYIISGSYSASDRQIILGAMEDYHKNTCIRFVPRGSGDAAYINIRPLSGCFSSVGMAWGNGAQDLSLGTNCVGHSTVIHELMHAVGFFHEQSRADRDSFVDVIEGNVIPAMLHNFDKKTLERITHLDAPYDYASVMHYGRNYFSRNGLDTLVKRKNEGPEIGTAAGFSKWDIIKINRLYNCEAPPPKPTTPPPQPTPGPRPTTGVVDENCYRRLPGMGRKGGGYHNLFGHGQPQSGPDVCEAMCNQKPECVGFEYGVRDKRCWYKKTLTPKAPNSAVDMYERICFPEKPNPPPQPEPEDRCINYNDQNRHCADWARQGECSRNSDNMWHFCKKSCCETGMPTPTTPAPKSSCRHLRNEGRGNEHKLWCDSWAKKGECNSNRQNMLANCAKSCCQYNGDGELRG